MQEHPVSLDKLEERLEDLNTDNFLKLKQILIKHKENFQLHCFKKEERNRVIPQSISGELTDEEFDILTESQMIDRWNGSEYMFQFRIHYIDPQDCPFLNETVIITTDFPLDHEDRVFPWVDEGKLMANKIYSEIAPDTRSILNMCCGAGTIAILLSKLLQKKLNHYIQGVDINERAIAIAQFNQRLNGITSNNLSFTTGNMFEKLSGSQYETIIADPPFALQPPQMEEHRHSQGGQYGDAKIKLFLKDVKQHLDPEKGQFYLLAYSLGSLSKKGREVEIERLLEENDLLKGRTIIDLPSDQPVWRFGDEKQVALNPMPVQYMSIRCGDPTYLISEDTSRINRYIKWIQEDLVEKNLTHLFYLIVHYSVNK